MQIKNLKWRILARNFRAKAGRTGRNKKNIAESVMSQYLIQNKLF
jgi:hypothetical protein